MCDIANCKLYFFAVAGCSGRDRHIHICPTSKRTRVMKLAGGTASLMRSSVNHLLARMDSCSVYESGPCMDMFKHDCHDISVHHEANQGEEKKKWFLSLSNGKSMWGGSESLPFVPNSGFSTLNLIQEHTYQLSLTVRFYIVCVCGYYETT